MLHLVSARVIKGYFVHDERFTGEVVHALCFGKQRFLTIRMNRLWSMNEAPENKKEGRPMYPNDWHETGENIMFRFDKGVQYVRREGVPTREVECIYLTMFWENDSVLAEFGWSRRALWGYDVIDITPKLILLQLWFRKSNARRKQRRLALAMALHPRLGNGSWLSIIPTELTRMIVLAA